MRALRFVRPRFSDLTTVRMRFEASRILPFSGRGAAADGEVFAEARNLKLVLGHLHPSRNPRCHDLTLPKERNIRESSHNMAP